MTSWRVILVLSMSQIISLGAHAQKMHTNGWLRFTLNTGIGKHWQAEMEMQHRRQVDYAQNDARQFGYPLASSVRLYLHYEKTERLRFTFSPISIWSHQPILFSDTDKEKARRKELRSALAVESVHNIRKHLSVSGRSGLEYRMFEHAPNALRFRERLAFKADIFKKIKCILYDEILLAHAAGQSSLLILDHNRLGLTIGWHPNRRFKVEGGYMYVLRNLQGFHFSEHNWVLQAAYQIDFKDG